MDNGISDEDFRGASIPERIYVFNNTFVANPYALTGGDNLIAVNNLFVGSTVLGIKNVDADSIVAYSLFWNNAADQQSSNVDQATSQFANPLLDANFNIQPGSPAIDAGTAHFVWHGESVLEDAPDSYQGVAPDLGRYESDFSARTPIPTIDEAPLPTSSPRKHDISSGQLCLE
jgi:hypothetical protein